MQADPLKSVITTILIITCMCCIYIYGTNCLVVSWPIHISHACMRWNIPAAMTTRRRTTAVAGERFFSEAAIVEL